MIFNNSTTFNAGDATEKLIYQPSVNSKYGVIINLTISSFLPSLPLLKTPEKGLLSLAEEWDERYAEFVKAGKHRRLGIYFKYPNNSQLIRRFGVLLFNKSPAEDIDLLAMLITRPKNLKINSGVAIYGKIEAGTFGLLEGQDIVTVWVDAEEKPGSGMDSFWGKL
ncbi:hypothetical protein [Floridanema aerugineum]|uniref:Uncharacterized protein n=1 Tax=Floridaenema aerugineum BLCC-F46 TaxID=3153654 RepID=A0ABV4X820_9CYAN